MPCALLPSLATSPRAAESPRGGTHSPGIHGAAVAGAWKVTFGNNHSTAVNGVLRSLSSTGYPRAPACILGRTWTSNPPPPPTLSPSSVSTVWFPWHLERLHFWLSQVGERTQSACLGQTWISPEKAARTDDLETL